jgi:hypothetical protein
MVTAPERRTYAVLVRDATLALVAMVVTWPVAARAATRLPLGTEDVATVPRFNLWTMEWNARGIGPFRHGFWDAPIFAPAHGTFAFSDSQPLTGAAFHVLVLIGCSATVAYAVVLLSALTLNGVGAASLLDRLGVAFGPATLGGVLMVALPFVANELGVLQLSMVWPSLFALCAVADYVRQPRWWRAALVGGWIVVSLLTSSYYALMLIIVVGIVALVLVASSTATRAQLGHLGALVATGAIFGGPFVLAEAHRLKGYEWSRATVAGLGAKNGDWLILDRRAWGTSALPWLEPHGAWRFTLYPGTVMLLLAVAGAITAWKSQSRWIIALLVVVAVTFVFAGGLGLEFFGWSPYSFLRDFVPGFTRIRSPFRFAVMTHVAIAVLAGFGLDALWRVRRQLGPALAILVTLLGVMEVVQLPAHTARAIEPGNGDWVAFLDRQPDSRVAIVPFPETGSVNDYDDTTEAMLLLLHSGQKLVNGYSGFFPSSYNDLRGVMLTFPDATSVVALREAHVRWVVVPNDWLTDARLLGLQLEGFSADPAFAGDRRSVWAVP